MKCSLFCTEGSELEDRVDWKVKRERMYEALGQERRGTDRSAQESLPVEINFPILITMSLESWLREKGKDVGNL